MPDAFALSAYDALFVVQRALEDVGDLRNFAHFKTAFVNEANAYEGVTGSTALDAAGDRLEAGFRFLGCATPRRRLRLGAYRNLC
jgi:hypothetical protein